MRGGSLLRCCRGLDLIFFNDGGGGLALPIGGRTFSALVEVGRFRDRDPIRGEAAPDFLRHVVVDRAGVRFLLGHAELRQHFQDLVRRDLELPRQLVYADFLHRVETASLSQNTT
jgi:hypothetical protein